MLTETTAKENTLQAEVGENPIRLHYEENSSFFMTREQATAILSVFHMLSSQMQLTPKIVSELAALYVDTYNGVPQQMVTDFLEDAEASGNSWPGLFNKISEAMIAFAREGGAVPLVPSVVDPIRESAICSLQSGEDSELLGCVDIDFNAWDFLSDTEKVRVVTEISEKIKQMDRDRNRDIKGGMVH